jgi:Trp operon repressor
MGQTVVVMAKPEISFPSSEEELNYGVKTLLEAGFSVKQIDRIRNEVGVGPGKIPYNKETVGHRRHMTAELLAASLSNRQIANVLNLSKETVSTDRNEIRKLYTEEILKSADVHRARLLKEQMELKNIAMSSFQESRIKRIVTTSSSREADKESSKEAAEESSIIRTETIAGDSSFLNVAKNCLVEQAKLLGLHGLHPQPEDKKDYKSFLDDLAKTVGDIKDREANAGAIEASSMESAAVEEA